MTLSLFVVEVLASHALVATFYVRARDAQDAKRFVRGLDGQADVAGRVELPRYDELRARCVVDNRRR